MRNFTVTGTNPDDPPEYDVSGSGDFYRAADYKIIEEKAVDPWLTYSPGPNDDAGTGHFDGLTPIEEVKQSFQRPQIAGVDW
jgi:hypothetical protein